MQNVQERSVISQEGEEKKNNQEGPALRNETDILLTCAYKKSRHRLLKNL